MMVQMLSPFINIYAVQKTAKLMGNIHEEVGTWTFLQVKQWTFTAFNDKKFTICTSDNSEIDRTYIVTPTVTAWPGKF